MERTGMATERTRMAMERTGMATERTLMTMERTGMAMERTRMAMKIAGRQAGRQVPVDEVEDMNELLQLEVGEVGGQHVGLDLLLDILPHPPSPILQLLHHIAAVERRLHHLTCICGKKGIHGDKSSGYACGRK